MFHIIIPALTYDFSYKGTLINLKYETTYLNVVQTYDLCMFLMILKVWDANVVKFICFL